MPELGSKRPIEIRDVAEAAVERDIEHPLGISTQPHGRVAQSRAQHVLMWGHASDSLERPQEVVRAEVGLPRQAAQRMVGLGMTIDVTKRPHDTSFGVQRDPGPVAADTRPQFLASRCEVDGQSSQGTSCGSRTPAPARTTSDDNACIYRELVIEASVEHVWDAIRDVGAVHTRFARDMVLDTRLDGQDRVVTFANGEVVRERIVGVDSERRRLAYAVVEWRTSHHNASFQVVPDGRTGCRLVWITDLLPDSMTELVEGFVDQGCTAIKRTLESSS